MKRFKSAFPIVLLITTLVLTSCKDDKVDGEWFTPVSNQPNILLVIADDVGIEAFPGYNIGAVKPNMPHLEALQKMGSLSTTFGLTPFARLRAQQFYLASMGTTVVYWMSETLEQSKPMKRHYINI